MAEAEIVLAAARRDLPADASVLQTWADAAAERGDLASALLRLRTLRKAFPDAAGVDLAIARTLRALGHLDEADAAFGALAKRYPADLGVVQEFASVASERSNVSEAIRRWTSVIAAFPDHVAGYWRLADALVRAERLSDADALLCDAAGRFRDDLETGLRWAMSGRATGDASRFDALCRRFPELAPLLA
jgi:predicted Zn-dependent protease